VYRMLFLGQNFVSEQLGFSKPAQVICATVKVCFQFVAKCGQAVCVCAEKLKQKRKYEWLAPPAEQRRSARLELKRQELEQLRLTQPMSSDDGSMSDNSYDDVSSSRSPRSYRRDSMSETADVTTFNDEALQPVPDHTPVSLPTMEGDVLEAVIRESNLVSRPATDSIPTTSYIGEVQRKCDLIPLRTVIDESNLVSKLVTDPIHVTSDVGEVQPPIKRKRGRPRKVRNEAETIPEWSGNSIAMEGDVQETVISESNLVPKPVTDPIHTTSDIGEVQPPIKRKRGRPRMVRNETETMLGLLSGNSTAKEGDVLETVIGELNLVSKLATNTIHAVSDVEVQPPVKRKRGRRRRVRNETETMPESSGNSAAIEGDVLETVIGESNLVSKHEEKPWSPMQVEEVTRTETMPELSGNSTSISESFGEPPSTQDDGLIATYNSTTAPCLEVVTTSGPEPMTLSLAPPPMPTGKVPQPAGVLLLPLYSSVPTEPGEQSSLMVIQPHQLANFPFAVGGHVSESGDPGGFMPPILTPSQPIVGPLMSHTTSGDASSAFVPPIFTPSQPIVGPLISNTTSAVDAGSAFIRPIFTPSQPIVGPLISQTVSGDAAGVSVPPILTASQPVFGSLISNAMSQSAICNLPSNESSDIEPASSL